MGKIAYRVKNWKTYNKALVNRGSLTVWLEEKAIEGWLSSEKTGEKGRSCTYSDIAIETGLTLRTLWKIPLSTASLRSVGVGQTR